MKQIVSLLSASVLWVAPAQVQSAVPYKPEATDAAGASLNLPLHRYRKSGALRLNAKQVTAAGGVKMIQKGKPIARSFQLVQATNGVGTALNQTYKAARAVIIPCGVDGYDLPKEDYDIWRDVELTFGPKERF